jgi:hypothetical protein
MKTCHSQKMSKPYMRYTVGFVSMHFGGFWSIDRCGRLASFMALLLEWFIGILLKF